ncbi:hypothetical protein AB4Y64_17745, partial [Lysobacter sp. TAF61]|uniref:hypothetical protein n=1 Tax=Lysobacter sp. TAF61 TaxID=3233072 RepID=UPI003F99955F
MANFTAAQRKNLIIGLATALVIGVSTWISLDPRYYFFYTDADRRLWHYPTMHFLVVCVIYVAESIFVAATIKLDARLWPRTLVATLIFLPWVAFSSMFVVHAPVYLHVHIVWTWLLLAVLVLITL